MNGYLQDYISSKYVEFSDKERSQRLNSLYSDFTRMLPDNQFGYQTNIEYWQSLLIDTSLEGCFSHQLYTIVLDLNTLAMDFLRPSLGRPQSLHLVLDSMKQTGDIMTLDQFQATYGEQVSWMSWFQHRLKPSASRNSVYVVIPTVRSIASDIRNKFNAQPVKSYTNTLLTLSDFRKHYGTYRHRSLTDLDLHLILKYMASQNMIALDNVVQDNKNQMVIKFIEPGMPNEIKDNEKAMISIRTTCDTLHLQIDRLQSRFEQLTTEAKSQHDLKHKPQALSSLKRRKQVLDMLSKRLGTLETVEGLLLKMESAKDDLQILQAFDQGANALRNMLSDQVSLEAVEDTMSKIHEAYADQQDVEQSMTQGMKSLDAVDDDDEEALLKELQELELESASAEDQQPASPASSPKLDSLPAPPTATPVPSSQNQERLDDDKTPTPNRVPVVE